MCEKLLYDLISNIFSMISPARFEKIRNEYLSIAQHNAKFRR